MQLFNHQVTTVRRRNFPIIASLMVFVGPIASPLWAGAQEPFTVRVRQRALATDDTSVLDVADAIKLLKSNDPDLRALERIHWLRLVRKQRPQFRT